MTTEAIGGVPVGGGGRIGSVAVWTGGSVAALVVPGGSTLDESPPNQRLPSVTSTIAVPTTIRITAKIADLRRGAPWLIGLCAATVGY